jgi:ribulose-5-phosphate 4-epimerase/fuculose-1-phosphate aldolase
MKPVPGQFYWIISEAIDPKHPVMIAQFVEPSRTYPSGRWYAHGQFYTDARDIVIVMHIRRPSAAVIKRAMP